jgi:phospholipase A1
MGFEVQRIGRARSLLPPSALTFSSTVFLIASLALCLTASPVARSQETQAQSPEACRAIRSEKDRLACYDALYGTPEGELFEQTPNPPAPEAAVPEPRPSSLLDQRWELASDQTQGTFRVSPHKPVYILAGFHSSGPNDRPSSPAEDHSVLDSLNLTNTETKFQISLKSKLWENILGDYSDLWFGYTQSSRWQLYNAALSRPFRETDYEPELLLNFRTTYDLPFGWTGRMSGVSFTHVSNGRDIPLSRSWNRVVGQIGIDRPGWTVVARPWWRIHEDADSDDNPDIEDFMGRAELQVTRNWRGHEISASFRHSLRDGDRSHGSVDLNWAFPIRGEFKGYLQFFSGYGESLIDYNHRANYVGLGVSLIEWYTSTAEATRD